MSSGPTFEEVIYHLQHNPDPAVRAQAAEMLGTHVTALDDAQYQVAHDALNDALIDPDPQVLLAAMNALSHFDRVAAAKAATQELQELGGATEAIHTALCPVCGKPEALVAPDECEFANCPYRR